jgi:cell fate (sporulation/competence/biofilm development) regulator YlbF (YheA/YmcA/DUF963 family)
MLEDKAREVGRFIGQSEEYKAVKRSSDALTADPEAATALRRMEEIRTAAQAMIDRGEQPGAAMEQELDQLLEKVQVNPAYQRAIVAQDNFDKLMLRVNQWIAEGIKAGAASPIITLG